MEDRLFEFIQPPPSQFLSDTFDILDIFEILEIFPDLMSRFWSMDSPKIILFKASGVKIGYFSILFGLSGFYALMEAVCSRVLSSSTFHFERMSINFGS